MRILALDIGTGTQDILLFDSSRAIENSVQLVMPAPTVIAARRVRVATQGRSPLVLTGTNMGGGPVTGAVEQHLAAGLSAYATPDAAVTFDDDPEAVRVMGITIVSEEEAARIEGVFVELKDLDLGMVRRALGAFEVTPEWDALAVAVFDHGNAPPGYSDRKFRFDYLRDQLTSGRRDVFDSVHMADELPEYLTRMRAVADTAGEVAPLLMTDTPRAAIMGSLEDPRVTAEHCKVVACIGNEHTLAFHLHGTTILGLFEHHTHVLSRERLEDHIVELVRGDLDGDKLWREQGHGAVVLQGGEELRFLSIIGPMRGLLEGSRLSPYFATPHGSMMLAGCFGLVRAWAERHPSTRDEIMSALRTVGEDIGHQGHRT
jgi:uncharacterized protein (DUF1786 family)